MRKIIFLLVLLTAIYCCKAQAIKEMKSQRLHEQAMKLHSAYKHHSVDELYQFFDNWASDIESTETAEDSPYLAEAYNVFRAFYQPLLPDYEGASYYKNKPYYIVQGSLWKISEAEYFQSRHEPCACVFSLQVRRR